MYADLRSTVLQKISMILK